MVVQNNCHEKWLSISNVGFQRNDCQHKGQPRKKQNIF